MDRHAGGVTGHPTLEATAILAALGVTSVAAIAPVGGGTDAAIWRVEHDGLTSALRVFRPEQAEACRREVQALIAAGQAGVIVPEVRAAGAWRNRPAQLLSWCPGVPLWEAIRRWPWRVWALGLAFGRAQAQIHRITAAPQLADLQRDWIAWAGPADEQLSTALERLSHPTPALLHLDYHPLNVLSDGHQITAVLDWVNAAVGDPRADLARTYTILRVEPLTPGRQPPPLTFIRRLLCWSWQRGYRQIAGAPSDMAWFYVWAGAVMARDLGPRVGDPNSWWQPRHLAHVQQWTAARRRRAERAA